MSNFKLKATHAPVKAYYETLERFGRGKFDNEGNVRQAFEDLLAKCARTFDWMVVPEYQITRAGKNPCAWMLRCWMPSTCRAGIGRPRTKRTT